MADREYVQEAGPKVWESFQTWRTDMLELRAIASTRPIPFSRKELISGVQATRLENVQSRYTSFVSGKLKRMWGNYTGRMLNGDFTIESQEVSDDRTEQARVEALLHVADGWIGMLDAEVRHGALGTSWRQQVADSIAITGKAIGLPLLRRDKDGHGSVECQLYDPINCAHTFGSESPWVFVSNRRMGAQTVKKELARLRSPVDAAEYAFPDTIRLEKPDDGVDLMEVWVEEEDEDTGLMKVYRACMVSGAWAGIQLTPFDHRPHIIGTSGSSVTSYQDFGATGTSSGSSGTQARGVAQDFVREHAQPFWSSLKHTHEQFGVVVSTAFGGIAQDLDPTLQIESETGGAVVDPSVLTAGGRIYSKSSDALRITAVERGAAQIAQGLGEIIKVINGEYDEVMNPALFGQRESGQSGFSQVTQISHSETVFHEPSAACRGFALDTLRELLYQFRRDDTVEFRFDAKTRGQSFQTMPAESFKSSDLPSRPVLNIDWEPDLGDDMQKITAAQQMKALGLPESFVLTRAMNIHNPQELMARARRELAYMSQPMQDEEGLQLLLEEWLEAADAARRARNPQRKRTLAVVASFKKGKYTRAEQQLKAMSGGTGTPAGVPGVPPQVLPPELISNPDDNAAAQGKQSSAPGGQGAVGVTGQGGGQALPMGV